MKCKYCGEEGPHHSSDAFWSFAFYHWLKCVPKEKKRQEAKEVGIDITEFPTIFSD